MDTKKLFALMIVALMGIVPVAAADTAVATKFTIEDVDYDDGVAPGSTVPVTVTLANADTSKDVEDITVKVWLEDSDGDLVGEKYKAHVVQVRQDDEKDVNFNIVVPTDTEEGEYTLKAAADGEWEDGHGKVSAPLWEDKFEVEFADDSVTITDLELSTGTATAGDSVDAAVAVLNNGNDDQTNVKVRVSLGEAESSVVIPMLEQAEESIVYLTLQLPKDMDAGIQTVKAQAYNGIVSTSATKNIVINEAKIVAQPTKPTQATFPVQTIDAGKAAVFSMQVTNNNGVAKTYNFAIGGLQDWASNTRVDPNSVTLAAGESSVVQVHLIPTASGEHTFALFVKDGMTTIATQLVKVSVTGTAATPQVSGETAGLVILAIIVLLALFAYFRSKGEEGGKKRETVYY